MNDHSVTPEAQPSLPIRIRRAIRMDVPFLTSSWLRSHLTGGGGKGEQGWLFYKYRHAALEHYIPQSAVLIACSEEHEDQILSWCCYEMTDQCMLFHYIYTKAPFRRYHIAKTLIDFALEAEQPLVVQHTHDTTQGYHYKKHNNLKWLYNPYVWWQRLPEGWASDINAQSDIGRVQGDGP